MNPDEADAATPLQHALDAFATSLGHLVKLVEDGALCDLDPSELIEFMRDVEQVRNRIPLIDHAVISHAVESELPGALCQRSINRVLTASLCISAAEAGRRVRAAEHLGPRRSLTGEPLPVWRPHLADAQRRGEITPEQVGVIDTELRKVDGRGFDPGEVESGERILVEAARAAGPEDLRGLATRVVEAIDPDGTLPDDEHQRLRRFFHLRAAKDGSFRGEFRLTPEVGQKLKVILDPLSAPQQTSFCIGDGETVARDAGPDSSGGDPSGSARDAGAGVGTANGRRAIEPDPRTRGQRVHDAIGQICDRLLRSGSLPDAGGTPTTLVVTIDADQLSSGAGSGSFADCTPVAAQSVIDLADQAEVAWCVKGSRGDVLALGRSRRLASPAQTLALFARDGGCSFPNCDVEPTWCERHHVIPWIDGGPTDLSNLTLVCRYHHHDFERRGWRCRIDRDGLPAWIPPKWIDRQQRPIVHPRILIRRWKPREALPDADLPW